MSAKHVNWPLGIIGGVAGAAAGYFLFRLLAQQGLYGMVVPGAMLGLGCGLLSGGRSGALGILCGFLAVPLGLFTEWKCFPFATDESLGFFLAHLGHLHGMTLVMIALGAVFAFWFGRGSERGPWGNRRKRSDHDESDGRTGAFGAVFACWFGSGSEGDARGNNREVGERNEKSIGQ